MAKPSKPNPEEVLSALRASSPCSAPDMEKLARAVLRPLLLLYYPPFRAETDDELLALAVEGMRLYVDLLHRYPVETLNEAWRRVAARHKVERWPVVAELVDACQQIGSGAQVNGGVSAGIPAWAETWARTTGTGRVASWLKDVSLEPTEPTATLWCATGFARDMLVNDRHLILDGVRQAHPKVTDIELIARDDPKLRAA